MMIEMEMEMALDAPSQTAHGTAPPAPPKDEQRPVGYGEDGKCPKCHEPFKKGEVVAFTSRSDEGAWLNQDVCTKCWTILEREQRARRDEKIAAPKGRKEMKYRE